MDQRSKIIVVGEPAIPKESARKLGAITGDRVCIRLLNPGDRPSVHRLRPAGFRAKRVDREGCR